MDEILPLDGWKACGIDSNSKGSIVKYKHMDMSHLHCPCCGESDLTTFVCRCLMTTLRLRAPVAFRIL